MMFRLILYLVILSVFFFLIRHWVKQDKREKELREAAGEERGIKRRGCRAIPGMFCTTQIREGVHTFTAQASETGQSISEGPVYIEGGTSPTWQVYVEQQ